MFGSEVLSDKLTPTFGALIFLNMKLSPPPAPAGRIAEGGSGMRQDDSFFGRGATFMDASAAGLMKHLQGFKHITAAFVVQRLHRNIPDTVDFT